MLQLWSYSTDHIPSQLNETHFLNVATREKGFKILTNNYFNPVDEYRYFKEVNFTARNFDPYLNEGLLIGTQLLDFSDPFIKSSLTYTTSNSNFSFSGSTSPFTILKVKIKDLATLAISTVSVGSANSDGVISLTYSLPANHMLVSMELTNPKGRILKTGGFYQDKFFEPLSNGGEIYYNNFTDSSVDGKLRFPQNYETPETSAYF